ncbi:hypothetical protein HUT16_17955 [Kitasatospora sp. NA04385]|uniref:hypothetical protein n=1 Tax=Kitasatospora sp. NA04385 TaxID=2742135 RepID=UPI001590FA9D|nr:hypothetical protein [Kitasatospora sp. NA04385]QKW20704.1 hypothetical protein HUT16_17955 [Kitasatospora sp. NA04385]
MSDEVLRQRAWRIAEQLAKAGGGGEAELTVIPNGYRIELDILRPHGTDDHAAVLTALALGDRWGHHYSPPSRNNGTARETVWSEVHHNVPEKKGS